MARRLEAALRAVCPELGATPIYLALRDSWGVCGATFRGMDLGLRLELPADAWRGRGIGIVLGPRANAREAGEYCRPRTKRLFFRTCIATALHELAHNVVDGLPIEGDPPIHAEVALEDIRKLFSGEARATNGPNAMLPWRYHEAPFIRACIHLAHRSERAARVRLAADPEDAIAVALWGIGPTAIFDATSYGLSRTAEYADALGDEPERLAHLSIFDLRKTPAPDAFTDLWRSDVRAWTDRFAAAIRDEQRKARRDMFDNLIGKIRKRREHVLASYEDIIKAIVDGKETDAEFAARIIADAAKTEADLIADVERETKRRDLQRKARSIDDITRELGEVDAKLAALAEKLERAQKAHDEAAGPLLSRERILRSALAEAEGARQRLAVEHPSAEYTSTASSLAAMRTRAYEIRNEIERLEREGAISEHHVETQNHTRNLESEAAKARRCRARVKELKSELAALDAAIPKGEVREQREIDALAVG